MKIAVADFHTKELWTALGISKKRENELCRSLHLLISEPMSKGRDILLANIF